MEAIDRRGMVLGAVMAGWRILRCHPFAHGGFDPVPLVSVQEQEVAAGRQHSTAHPCTTH
jgi:putative component of membrane protein insertase Oxa1/YidC/SpoIIIJ protein YidD